LAKYANFQTIVKFIGEHQMRRDLFQPTVEGEARLLLLIEAFSTGNNVMEGRTKIAKLDFFLRYPNYFNRAMRLRGVSDEQQSYDEHSGNIETKMIRYRYGPWDPSYYAILGRLIGKGLIAIVPLDKGIGYKATDKGRDIVSLINKEPVWQEIIQKLKLLKNHLNLTGTTLKKFIYDNFPEITKANWGESL
jgi:hypothetical protein